MASNKAAVGAALLIPLAYYALSKKPNCAAIEKACANEKQALELAMEQAYRSQIREKRRAYYDCYYMKKYETSAQAGSK